jgi:hypothetical protein
VIIAQAATDDARHGAGHPVRANARSTVRSKDMALPAWFAGKANLTGGTVVALVSNDVELLAHEAEVTPGHWELFPATAAGQAAANAYVGSGNAKGAATTPGNPVNAVGAAAGAAVKAVTGGSVFGVHFAAGALRAMVVRTVKVILGLAMVIVGVMHLTGTSQALTKVAKTAGIAAVA